jgi:hypothetical protein
MQVAYARSFGRSDTGLLGVYYVTELDKIMEAQWVGLVSCFDIFFLPGCSADCSPLFDFYCSQVVMREFQNLCHKVTDEAVEVAKAQVKSTIVGQLDAGLAQVRWFASSAASCRMPVQGVACRCARTLAGKCSTTDVASLSPRPSLVSTPSMPPPSGKRSPHEQDLDPERASRFRPSPDRANPDLYWSCLGAGVLLPRCSTTNALRSRPRATSAPSRTTTGSVVTPGLCAIRMAKASPEGQQKKSFAVPSFVACSNKL